MISRPIALLLAAGLALAAALPAPAQDRPASAPATAPGKQPAAPVRDGPVDPATAQPSIRFGLKEAPARTKGAIRVTTYNIENLFDDKDDPALTGDNDDKDMTKPAALSQAAADAIKALNADVIALQEIESLQALTQFRDTYLTGLGYDHIVSLDSGDFRGIENAVISRFPLEKAEVWPNLPLGGEHPATWGNEPNREAGKPILFRRSPLRVTVVVPAAKVAQLQTEAGAAAAAAAPAADYRLTLFVVHNKSGRPGAYWREREARKTVELIGEYLKQNPAGNILVLGDFNAQENEESFKILERGNPSIGVAPLTDLLPGLGRQNPKTTTHSSGRAIDHILFGSNLAGEILPDTAFVLGTIDRPAGAHWRPNPPPPGYASDHYPVSVDILPINKPAAAATPATPTPAPAPANPK
ncbi:MAG: endonuclease/exonuclease/phosphatase family protein [Phycisphaerales bacterium]|nr:endonuclease/exonuclease/phosphatase family protein [Phycisphaerales bacterium]